MSIKICDRILRIQRGQEQKFHVSNEICCEHSFMYPAFLQAQRALSEILRHTEAFYQINKGVREKEKGLFEYGGNIILFAAPRGGGKTRMMLSFSNILEQPDAEVECCSLSEKCTSCKNDASSKRSKWLGNSVFHVTDPIAPAVLENGQNVLYVVLSRLYRYAEMLLSDNYARGRVTESQKNELYMAFNNCLSGINGIKQDNSSTEDFTILQELSDGLSLRYHFYSLVSKLLEIAAPQKGESARYLVLQFDDADSKSDNVLAVFEDIRKYLLIPNLVILMSADLDSLHKVITQEHLKSFSEILKFVDAKYSQSLDHLARKYIDKLIPPSHLVVLPNFGKMSIAEIRQLKLLYVDNNGRSVLYPHLKGVDIEDSNMDALLLKLVYKKTGIIFVRPATYLHNLIPWTPRGLNQMLYLLSEMEDIPAVRNYAPASEFIGEISVQCEIAQRNIAQFYDYFVNDWIKVKIRDFEDQKFFVKFLNARPAERIKEAILYLQDKFKDMCDLFNQEPNGIYLSPNLYVLNRITSILLGKMCTQDEYLLLFTLHTLLTLCSHRLIWERKHETVRQFANEKRMVEETPDPEQRKKLHDALENKLIAFSFSSESEIVTSIVQHPTEKGKTNPYLPLLTPNECNELLQVEKASSTTYEAINELKGLIDKGIPIDNVLESCKAKFSKDKTSIAIWEYLRSFIQDLSITESNSKEVVDVVIEWLAMQQEKLSSQMRIRRITEIFCSRIYSNVYDSNGYEMNLMNVFLLLLHLDDRQLDIETLTSDMEASERQREMYQLQEYGLMIATNWDVLKKIYRHTSNLALVKDGMPGDTHLTFDTLFQTLLENVKSLIPSLYDANTIFDMKIVQELRRSCSIVYEAGLELIENRDEKAREAEFIRRVSMLKNIGPATIEKIKENRLTNPSEFSESNRKRVEEILGKPSANIIIQACENNML